MTAVDVPQGGSISDVVAVIVAYRSAANLREGIPALLRDPVVTRVVVVDNSADQESRQVCAELARSSGRVQYVASPNIGFARGCNLGVRGCDESFLLFVNPDVVLSTTVGPLREPLLAGRAAISAGLLLTPPDGTNLKRLASPGTELRRAVVGARRGSRPVTALEAEHWVRAPQLDGAFLLLHRDTWAALGGFDERFELYYEDVDLCRRAVPLGGSIADTTRPYGRHDAGASFTQSVFPAYTVLRISRVRYLRKHFGFRGGACAAVVAVLEWLSRTVTDQPEGAKVRRVALRAQFEELRRPGSVWALQPTRPTP